MTQGNPRSTAIRAVAKANGLDLQEVETDLAQPTEEFTKANPLKKVPAFVGADGFTLTECIAIAIYGTWYSGFDGDIAPLSIPSSLWRHPVRCSLSCPLQPDDLDIL